MITNEVLDAFKKEQDRWCIRYGKTKDMCQIKRINDDLSESPIGPEYKEGLEGVWKHYPDLVLRACLSAAFVSKGKQP